MISLRSIVLVTVCLLGISYATELEDYRLNEDINPVHYNITLRPYLLESDIDKRFTFDGEVWIEVVPTKTTSALYFHSKSLNYTVTEYWSKPAAGVAPTILSFNSLNYTNVDTNIVNLNTSTPLTVNQSYILHFVYRGLMEDDMHGFYRSSYVDDNNVTKYIGSTQFQTNHARRAFPSFDEPQFKATFNVTLKRHYSFNTASNTRLIGSYPSEEEGYYIDVYNTTPIMSTYLLAFLVSEFSSRSDTNFSVLSRPEYYGQTQYSFNVGRKILKEIGSYLNWDYYEIGNNKMAMAAIPDFSAGAMENWGLLTYRERSLLVEDSVTTLSSIQAIAAVVAHEQAHMWFGDLVTCKWWSYTWLNEGFARYFQYFGTAFVENQWELEKQFVVDQIQSVMGMDSTNATNPLTDENTYTPAHLSRMFNSISYNKGATFIRMIEHTMGSENFQKSLQEYLKKYQYQSSVPNYLLEAWQTNWPEQRFNSSSENIFNSFTKQVGYPVIYVEPDTARMGVHFSQKRFLLKESEGVNSSLVYTVPITYTTDLSPNFVNTTPKFILYSNNATIVAFATPLKWIIANIQQTGYYRVNYTEYNWYAIHDALITTNWSGIHEINRAQIVDDLLNLARAGDITYNLTLDVIEYLSTETNYIPWTSAFNGLNFLSIRLGTDIAHFNNYIQQLTYKAYNKVGFNEAATDTALDIYLRTKVLSWNCRYGNADCVTQAKNYFSSLSTVPKNIRSVVYCVGLREGGSAEFDALYEKFKTATVATEETLLQTSFGCVKNQTLIERVFDLVISDEIRKQDKSSVLSTLYTENNENVSPVFALVTTRFEDLANAMGSYASVATVISNIAARFTEQSQYDDLKKFNTANGDKFGSSNSTLFAAETTVSENLQWAESKLGVFKSYLAQRNGSAMTTSAFSILTLVMMTLATLLLR